MSILSFRSVIDPFRDFMAFDPIRDFDIVPGDRPFSALSSVNETKPFVPLLSTDLIETDRDYHVCVDLPGVELKDIDISVQEGSLVMKAERKQCSKSPNDKIHCMERSYGLVQRRIQLPKNADFDHANTTFKNGVLTVVFPKLTALPTTAKKLMINA